MDAQQTRTCNGACRLLLPLTKEYFEPYSGKFRSECKKCRANKKAEKAKTASASIDRSTVPKPKACTKCGKSYPEVDFKWRTDVQKGGWREICNVHFNEKKYYEAYRKRERAKDEVAYLERNAKSHLEWSHRNPDKIKEQQMKERMEPDRRIKALVTEAKARDIFIDIDGLPQLKVKFSEPCNYCAFVPEIGKDYLNGLDRLDVKLGFTDANTVPCCGVCNHMKGPQDVDEFIDNIRRISKYMEIDIDSVVVGARTPARPLGGWSECREAPAKEKKDFLTLNQKIKMWSSPCYLCGRSPCFGIDRLDADGDYTVDNSKPCCTDCNYMKSDRSFDHFKTHIGLIDAYTSHWVLRDIRDVPMKVLGGKQREPIAMLDDNKFVLIVFPSAGRAAEIIGASRASVLQAVNRQCRCLGMFWRSATSSEYRNQHMMPRDGRSVIESVRKLT